MLNTVKTRVTLTVVLLASLAYCSISKHELAAPDRAKAACRGEIKKRLKDPGSAEFGKAVATQTATGGWLVYRELTARNSFNATVKSVVVCEVTPNFVVVKATF